MADPVPDSSAPIQVADSNSEIEKLRSEIDRLRSEMQGMRDAVAQEVLSRIRLQGAGGIQVSGGNGNFTIGASIPKGGNITGAFDCDSDPKTFNGTLTLF